MCRSAVGDLCSREILCVCVARLRRLALRRLRVSFLIFYLQPAQLATKGTKGSERPDRRLVHRFGVLISDTPRACANRPPVRCALTAQSSVWSGRSLLLVPLVATGLVVNKR